MVEFRYPRIKEMREAYGLTLEDMAGKMGKQKQQLAIWESGVNSPSIENLVLICNTFDIDVSFFFDSVSTHVEEKQGE